MSRPSAARMLLTFSACYSWVITSSWVFAWDEVVPGGGWLTQLLTYAIHPAFWLPCTVVMFTAAWAFLKRRREHLAAGTMLALLALTVQVEEHTMGEAMPQVEAMLSGGLLATWLFTRMWAVRRDQSPAEADATAHNAVCGVFGAMLSLAAASKAAAGADGWIDGGTQCAIIYEQAELTSQRFITSFRLWLARQYTLCSLGALYVLVVEAAGVLFAWPGARKVYSWTVLGVFGSLSLITVISEPTWGLMALALAYSTLGNPKPKATS